MEVNCCELLWITEWLATTEVHRPRSSGSRPTGSLSVATEALGNSELN